MARKYDHEYKVQAVKLAKEIGGTKAAKELGIPEGTMHTWLKAVRTGKLDIGEGSHTPASAMSLSEEIKARYRSMYTGVFFKRYIMGLWAMAEGVIYDMFDADKHTVDTEALAAIYKARTGHDFWVGDKYVSCDYGTRNPTAFLLWQQGADKKWYCRREYYYSGRANKRQMQSSPGI